MLQNKPYSSPIGFEMNLGQTDADVRFVSRLKDYDLFLTDTEAVISLAANNSCTSLRLSFAGNSKTTSIIGVNKLTAKANYFNGANPSSWVTDVPLYGKVMYRNVYPGIDAIFYGTGDSLEWDLVISPGADPNNIIVNFDGAEQLSLTDAGDLLISTLAGEVTFRRPFLYQQAGDVKNAVVGQYMFLGNTQIGFLVGDYDASQPLVIDPVVEYASYLGGSNDDAALQITIDRMGYMYIIGETNSINFPTAAPYQALNAGGKDVTITKMTPDGSSLVFSTYLGGSGNDSGTGIAVDQSGYIYITGSTTSADFPVQNPLQAANAGGSDIFITKLNPSGSALIFSTYLGGTGNDNAKYLAIDSANNIYVAGYTASVDFPVLHAYQSAFGGGSSDGFIVKLDSSGSTLEYSSYLGGSGEDVATAVAVDTYGSAYITGYSASSDFPVSNALQPSNAGGRDVFVTKLNIVGTVVYSTYLGGSGTDEANGIAVAWNGAAVITGTTASANFPVLAANQNVLAGGTDAFVTKLNPDGSSIAFSTYWGGSLNDRSLGIAIDAVGYIYITGGTLSSDFPVDSPTQPTLAGGEDCFVTMFDPNGLVTYSSYLGGTNTDYGTSIAADAMAYVYVCGETFSTDFPTVNPYQAANAGNKDMFIAILDLSDRCTQRGILTNGVLVS